MSVWIALPIASDCTTEGNHCADVWRHAGYRVCVLTDGIDRAPNIPAATLHLHQARYRGWARACNTMCVAVLAYDEGATAVVCVGHDQFPDATPVAELEQQFGARFPDGYGVMQPTGDGFCGNGMAAVSPWLGRAWITEAYEGHGPLNAEYFHFCADSELWAVANEQGVYYERPDLSQYHDHWTRRGVACPDHLQAAHEAKDTDHVLFLRRREACWPGSRRKGRA